MYDNRRPKSEILIPLIWMSTGFLSWYLSTYFFSNFLSMLLIDRLRTINTLTQSLFIKNLANMIYANLADFVLCFLFSMLLSYFTKFTKYRISMFIFGAIAISLYVRIEKLFNQIKIYSEVPSWAMTSYLQGSISLLIIVPILSLMGCKTGQFLRIKKENRHQRHE
jgi:hypothetical protein